MTRLLTIACVLLAATIARGEEVYPARPITLVVPYPPGGVTDTLARLLADRMKTPLGQSIVVENVGGAGGSIGIGRVARATPDGYTIAIGSSETHVLNAVSLSLPYDVVTDFAPVVQLPAYPFLIVSSNAVPAKTLKELAAWIKANPAKVTQGTVGYGTVQHMCGVIMQKAIGVTWQLVPYRGGAPAMQDLLSGQFNLMCTASGSFLPLVRTRQIRAYAITTAARAESAPDIPTTDEAGLPGLHLLTWNALWAPKGTPKPVVARLNAAAVQAMADPAFKQRMIELALEMPPPDQLTPEALAALQKAEIEKWWPLMRAAGIKQQ
ncbi:MAG TPA: tripartite tricarboxylate transporter substrate-binding protein [Xanthobacteraceae bacterium]|nr:tripartite tricarboxylate transporter substrate-binding protein [Xanthobacteraceae bacterium]